MRELKKIQNFTAIDFETAQSHHWSICQVGLVRIEGGKVVDTLNILVKPPRNYYHYFNTKIHGISAADTVLAPTFDEVWHKMDPFIRNQHVVAHNALFDCSCIEKTLQYYHMDVPAYEQHCTYKIYRSNLKALSAHYGIPLRHHDALSDAMACAQLFLMFLQGKTKAVVKK